MQEEAHEAASLYRGFVALYGFLLVATGKPEPAKLPTPERARDAVCAFLRDGSLALEAKKPPPAATATCFDGQRTIFRSREPQLDGDFHVLGLGSSTFAVLYQPPDRTTLTPPYDYELSKLGRFVISKMQQDAYWCSTNPTCYRGLPDDEDAPGYYCYDSSEQCARRGFNTRVFVLDTLTERTVRFGAYDWQSDPQVVASEHELKVTTDRCSQAWPL